MPADVLQIRIEFLDFESALRSDGMRWLCPAMIPGVPGSATPDTFSPGASRWVMYQPGWLPGDED